MINTNTVPKKWQNFLSRVLFGGIVVLSTGIEPILPDPQSGVLSVGRRELICKRLYLKIAKMSR